MAFDPVLFDILGKDHIFMKPYTNSKSISNAVFKHPHKGFGTLVATRDSESLTRIMSAERVCARGVGNQVK